MVKTDGTVPSPAGICLAAATFEAEEKVRGRARAEQDQQGRGQGDHENLPQAQTSRTGFIILPALLSSVSKVGQTFDNIPPCFRLHSADLCQGPAPQHINFLL